MYIKQYFTRPEFKRGNFNFHPTLPFCETRTSQIYFGLNHIPRENPLPPLNYD